MLGEKGLQMWSLMRRTWGRDSLTDGADSSGFVKSVYEHFGIDLPHNSREQITYGSDVCTLDAALPGDLLFYSTPFHVAIYLGDGKIIHAMPELGICVSEVDFDQVDEIRRIIVQ